MTCDLCKLAPATQIISQKIGGQDRIAYRCDSCRALACKPTPTLSRPCHLCRLREGEIKIVRIRPQGRVITYVCIDCSTRSPRRKI